MTKVVKVKIPRRLRILPHMSIDGVRENRRLREGLYELGKNMTEAEAIRLASPEFSHCVQVLADRPEPEALAADGDLPQATPGYVYSRKKQHEQELEHWERDHGPHTHVPNKLKPESEPDE